MSQHSRGVDVDLDGLRAFVQQLEANIEQDLKPGISRAENEIHNGVGIGRAFPGGQIVAARQMLIYAMERVRENAARHIQAGEILSLAIKRATANYTQSDRDAASRLAKIEDALLEAVAAAQRATQPPPPASPPEPSTGPQP